MNTILIYWVLPSLVTFLLISVFARIGGEPLFNKDYGYNWVAILLSVIVYPVMWFLWLWEIMIHFKVAEALAKFGKELIKERSFRG